MYISNRVRNSKTLCVVVCRKFRNSKTLCVVVCPKFKHSGIQDLCCMHATSSDLKNFHGIRKFTNCVRVSLNQTYEDDSLNAILLLVIRTWCQYHMLNSKCEMKRKENITAFLRTAPGARVLDVRMYSMAVGRCLLVLIHLSSAGVLIGVEIQVI